MSLSHLNTGAAVSPIGYAIDAERRVVFVRAWGAVGDAALRAQAQGLKSDPRMEADFGLLVDARGVTAHAMTLQLLQRYPTPFSTLARRAIVVGDVHGLALAQVYSWWNAEEGSGFVTRDTRAALAWLRLPSELKLPDQLDAEFGVAE